MLPWRVAFVNLSALARLTRFFLTTARLMNCVLGVRGHLQHSGMSGAIGAVL